MARNTPERTEATRDALLDAARHLFVTHGYADTATPDIVAAAGVTRGALYHHFADKRALFRAVVEREAARVADAIAQSSGSAGDNPLEALLTGMTGYFDAMEVAGRARLLLVEGPAALGAADMLDVDRSHALRTLEEGLAAALPGWDRSALAPLAELLSAAFDRAVLSIASGSDRQAYVAAMETLIRALLPVA